MRGYLKLGDSKGDDIPEDTIKAVADTLRTSSALKISEDGESYNNCMIELSFIGYSLQCFRLIQSLKKNL